MDIQQALYDIAFSMINGVAIDVKTLLSGGIVLVFILVGFGVLKTGFDHMNRSDETDSKKNENESFFKKRHEQ